MAKSIFLPLRLVICLIGLLGWAHAGEAAAKCEIQQVAELHVVMDHNRALVPVEIDGHPVEMIIDTGAGVSMLFQSNIGDFNLPTHNMPPGSGRLYGVGGEAHVRIADLDEFKLESRYTAKNIRMLVGDGSRQHKSKIVGLIGQDILAHWDVEFDLAHSLIRFIHPASCHGDEVVYWSAAYSRVPMEYDPSLLVHTTVRALLNGRPIDAYLDTGAMSIVTLGAAASAGVRPTSSNVSQAGVARGLGGYSVPIWAALFDSFTIGDETIRHVKIKMGDMFEHATYEETGSFLAKRLDRLPGMLLGADFFMAHRVLISNSQQVVYFTYNGGPVFDTSQPPTPVSTAPASGAATPDPQATKPPQVQGASGKGG